MVIKDAVVRIAVSAILAIAAAVTTVIAHRQSTEALERQQQRRSKCPAFADRPAEARPPLPAASR